LENIRKNCYDLDYKIEYDYKDIYEIKNTINKINKIVNKIYFSFCCSNSNYYRYSKVLSSINKVFLCNECPKKVGDDIFYLLSLYYEIYEIENILNIDFRKSIKIYENKFREHRNKIIMPLKLYDAKINKIIYSREDKQFRSYVTISHRWDDEDENIDLNELNKYKKINEIRNIYKKNSDLRYFWLDTICINQKDIKEKEREIPNMKNYYKNSLMTIILSDICIQEQKLKIFPIDRLDDFELIHDLIDSIKFQCDWYNRCWTLQEIFLNKNIYIYIRYDSSLLSLNYLSRICRQTQLYEKNSLYSICLDIKYYKNNKYDINNILELSKNRKCKLSQDKVYSILGLIDEKISENIKISYNLELYSIFINLFKEALKVNNYSWLTIFTGLKLSPIDVLYINPIVNDSKFYIKSYVVKDSIKDKLKIVKHVDHIDRFCDFIEEFSYLNNISFNKENFENFYEFIDSGEYNFLEKFGHRIDLSCGSIGEYIIYNDYYNFFGIFSMTENVEIPTINEYDSEYDESNCKDVYDLHYKDFWKDVDFILNNYKNLPKNWWNCIIIKNNIEKNSFLGGFYKYGKSVIGHAIIKVEKDHLTEKEIEINLDLKYHLCF
jgi:hypothetical protein